MRKILQWIPTIFMFVYALGLLVFAVIYWVELIRKNRWDELPIRIIVMILTMGSVFCFALSKILHNQKKILDFKNCEKDKQPNSVAQATK